MISRTNSNTKGDIRMTRSQLQNPSIILLYKVCSTSFTEGYWESLIKVLIEVGDTLALSKKKLINEFLDILGMGKKDSIC